MNTITKDIYFLEDDTEPGESEYMTNGDSVPCKHLSDLDAPLENYRVTYTLDPTGPYEVTHYGRTEGVPYLGITDDLLVYAPVCWLPNSWYGQQVTRTVMEITP